MNIDALAWSDLLESPSGEAQRKWGLEVDRVPPLTTVRAARIPSPLCNRVWGLDDASSATGVDTLLGRFHDLGIDRYFITVRPESTALADRLAARGLARFHRPWVELTRGRAGPVPSPSIPFRIRPVNADHARLFGQILADAFDLGPGGQDLFAATVGRPGWHGFLAFDAEQPIAAGNLFVHDEQAYLAGGATVSTHRRRGAQLALLAVRVGTALDLGCTTITSETGVAMPGQPNSSEHNMRRCGLRPVGRREHFCPPSMVQATRAR